MVMSFKGEIVGRLDANPGIVLYTSSFNLDSNDGQLGIYEVLVA